MNGLAESRGSWRGLEWNVYAFGGQGSGGPSMCGGSLNLTSRGRRGGREEAEAAGISHHVEYDRF